MEKLLRFPAATACIGAVCIAFLSAQPLPQAWQPEADRMEWVEQSLKDFESMKVGMTRAELEAKMSPDGGIRSAGLACFVHPECPSFKMDVEFDFKRDPANQNRAVESKDDKVTKLSKPYLERPFID
jgi:hypothetical protein